MHWFGTSKVKEVTNVESKTPFGTTSGITTTNTIVTPSVTPTVTPTTSQFAGKLSDTYDRAEMLSLLQNQNQLHLVNWKTLDWKGETWTRLATAYVSTGGMSSMSSQFEVLMSDKHIAIRTVTRTHRYGEENDTPTIDSEFIMNDVQKFLSIMSKNKASADSINVDRVLREIDDKLKILYLQHCDNPTVEDVLNCRDMEVRTEWIKKYGFEKVKKYAKVLDEKDSYILFDLEMGGDNLGRFLKMNDSSTDRQYLLRVKEEINVGGVIIDIDTVDEALAWSFDVPSGDYHPTVET